MPTHAYLAGAEVLFEATVDPLDRRALTIASLGVVHVADTALRLASVLRSSLRAALRGSTSMIATCPSDSLCVLISGAS